MNRKTRDTDLLRPAEAARLFGISTATLMQWKNSGLIPEEAVIKLPSAHHRYRKPELLVLRNQVSDGGRDD